MVFVASFVSLVCVVSAVAEAEAAREAESVARQEAAAAHAHKTSVVEQLQAALSGSASFEGEAEGLRRALEEAQAARGAAETEAARLRADMEAAATGAAEGLEGMRSRAEEAAAEVERLGAELEGREREVGMAEEVVRGLRAELEAAGERSSSLAAQVSPRLYMPPASLAFGKCFQRKGSNRSHGTGFLWPLQLQVEELQKTIAESAGRDVVLRSEAQAATDALEERAAAAEESRAAVRKELEVPLLFPHQILLFRRDVPPVCTFYPYLSMTLQTAARVHVLPPTPSTHTHTQSRAGACVVLV